MPSSMVFLPLDDFYLTPFSTVRTWAGAVQRAVPALDVHVVEPGEDPRPALQHAHAVFGALTAAQLAHARGLRWLQAPAAAPPAEFWFDELVDHAVVVTNLRGVYRDNLADHVLAVVLGFARGLPTFAAAQRRGEWCRELGPTHIADLGATTMLIVGVGAVGTAIAHRARAFGMRVVGIDRDPDAIRAAVDDAYPPAALDQQLPDADWVVLTVPHTPETEHLMDARSLACMATRAVLVNVGRGETVVLEDLTAALARGEIAGAALDVFETEPLPPSHALWRMPNVVITPHVAGFGKDTDGERQALIVDNARRFAHGRPLRNVVDKAVRC